VSGSPQRSLPSRVGRPRASRFSAELAERIRYALSVEQRSVRSLAREYRVEPVHIRLIRDGLIWKR
jgi:hypothetical protein